VADGINIPPVYMITVKFASINLSISTTVARTLPSSPVVAKAVPTALLLSEKFTKAPIAS
jgi:hypothetical protein